MRNTKQNWLYIFVDPNKDLNSIQPPLPKQAKQIASILKEKASLKRPELLTIMEETVRTKQKGGTNRILAYYQGLLTRSNIIELRKNPE
tara:strand:+ start:1501 stop:1767 length:267 start_codon:yes stop_codon:yes gene_type:complete